MISKQMPVCLADYEALALEQLDPVNAAYLFSAAGDELTTKWNSEAFNKVTLVPRILKNISGGNTQLELLGQKLTHPIIIAPMAFQKLAHTEAEEATALAAAAQEALMVLSCNSTIEIEKVSAVGECCNWFQLYMQPNKNDTLSLIKRAEDNGFKVLIITCDASVSGIRNQEQRMSFQLPPEIRAVNLDGFQQPNHAPLEEGESAVFDRLVSFAPTWDDISWLRSKTNLPIILKGVLHPSDAKIAIDAGVAGIIVSNHGGRTLDTAPATLDILPEISDAVAGQIPILLDGGIRRGTDIVKALALGATAILLGRPILHGLVVDGPRGASHVLRILRDELEVTMALTGCKYLSDISKDILRQA